MGLESTLIDNAVTLEVSIKKSHCANNSRYSDGFSTDRGLS